MIAKIIRKKDLCEHLGISAATLYRWEREGIFPKRKKIGPYLVGWLASEVEDWIRSRKSAPENKPTENEREDRDA